MSEKEKLLKRFIGKPNDFTFDELEVMLSYLGYKLSNKGKTSGSAVCFESPGRKPILLHKPHGRNNLLIYQIKIIEKALKEEGLL